jgi:DNA (cytosine-5)-methyltransferase 1
VRQGLTFRRWWRQLENLGYTLDARELRACDYGAPTTRQRLFIFARCDGQPIRWPEPSHGPGRIPYRGAAECIDWAHAPRSVFLRPRPLAAATLDRIAAGVTRYVTGTTTPYLTTDGQGGPMAAFVAKHYTGVVGSDLRDPLGTITAVDHHALVSVRLRPVGAESDEDAVCRGWVRERLGREATVRLQGVRHYVADVGHRMLTPGELFAAQGFPADLKRLGSIATQIRLCGNSVSPPVAAAVIRARSKRGRPDGADAATRPGGLRRGGRAGGAGVTRGARGGDAAPGPTGALGRGGAGVGAAA